MKLLIDNQLPEALGRYLAENGFEPRNLSWTRPSVRIKGCLARRDAQLPNERWSGPR